MDLIDDWSKIRKHFSKSIRSSLHVSIASVNPDNTPTTTPIGSFFLNEDQTGFYFEKFSTKLRKNSESNKNICLLGVNSSLWFWVKSLFRGKFKDSPAIKLYGILGERMKASETQTRAMMRRTRFAKGLKAHKYLWGDMYFIREITFHKVEKMNLGKMTKEL